MRILTCLEKLTEQQIWARGAEHENAIEQARNVMAAQTAESLVLRTTVQGYDGPPLNAIFHVLLHFSEHIGQIQFITKALTGQDLGFYAHLNKPKHGQTTP